ncbi:MAG: hypothetical protein ACD_28C00332G0002 [uncultured bacterium]|nr:MAG: hypothetical protein ACD_28C00332G0002 [uncultured bacterium]KKT76224.1 MAG: hypothetical protein UW70_C0020G0002 [Candidatus Peregrinibacteria bacterium GW2011_GWA2_44_7]
MTSERPDVLQLTHSTTDHLIGLRYAKTLEAQGGGRIQIAHIGRESLHETARMIQGHGPRVLILDEKFPEFTPPELVTLLQKRKLILSRHSVLQGDQAPDGAMMVKLFGDTPKRSGADALLDHVLEGTISFVRAKDREGKDFLPTLSRSARLAQHLKLGNDPLILNELMDQTFHGVRELLGLAHRKDVLDHLHQGWKTPRTRQ